MAQNITPTDTPTRPDPLPDERSAGYEHYSQGQRHLQPPKLRARRRVWIGHLVSQDPWTYDHYEISPGEAVRVIDFTNAGFRGIEVYVEFDTDTGPKRGTVPAGAFTAVR